MASSDIDFSDYKRIAPPYDEPPRQRGCLFYGCIIAIVLSLLFMIAVGVIAFLLYRWIGTMVDEYTATAPRALPTVAMPAEERATLKERVEAFKAAVKERRQTPPLILTSDELNALIEDNPDLRGKVYVAIERDKLKGQVSLPLSEIPSFGLTRGRYLNGEAEFNVRLEDGEPFVTIGYLEVNGKRPSDEFMKGLKGQNLLRNIQTDPETTRTIRGLDSVEVKDGKLVITARERRKPPEDAGASTPTGQSPAPERGAATLPDDVLAPPDSRPAVPIESTSHP